MNFTTPILICDVNEEVRLLIKDMFIKNGFFHLLEAHSGAEVVQLLEENHFLLIHKNLLDREVRKLIPRAKSFLIIAQNNDPEAVSLAATYGVAHLMSFPYSSTALMEKVRGLLSY